MTQPLISVHGRQANSDEGAAHFIVPLAELERIAIISALQTLNGRTDLAAKALGIAESMLLTKLRQYEL